MKPCAIAQRQDLLGLDRYLFCEKPIRCEQSFIDVANVITDLDSSASVASSVGALLRKELAFAMLRTQM